MTIGTVVKADVLPLGITSMSNETFGTITYIGECGKFCIVEFITKTGNGIVSAAFPLSELTAFTR